MSETEEPQIEDDAPMSDTTEASNLSDVIPETSDLRDDNTPWEKAMDSTDHLPASDITEASDTPETNATANGTINMPELTNLPESTDVPAEDFPESTDIPIEGTLTNMDANLPALKDLPETEQATNSVADTEGVLMEGMELEERLQESLDSQDQEGQEEWLSEGVLTDDDGNPASQASESNSQEENSQHLPTPLDEYKAPKTEDQEMPEQNIEDALNDLQGGSLQEGLPDGLDAFLIKKPQVKLEVTEKPENGNEENDGNDTDDLLRMLSEDNNKKKKLTKTVKDVRNAMKAEPPSTDDDDDEYEVSSKKVKLTKSLPIKVQIKNESNITDKGAKKIVNTKAAIKPKAEETGVRHQETQIKTVQVMQRIRRKGVATSTPVKKATRSLLKPAPAPVTRPTPDNVQIKREPAAYTYSRYSPRPVLRPAPKKEPVKPAPPHLIKREVKCELEEVMHDEEFLDEDQLNMDEDELDAEYGSMGGIFSKNSRQDGAEAVNGEERGGDESDPDSQSEDGSLYDALPSSESEDVEDWFQVDIRAERASEYLPLLGSRAKEILLEEKRRVAARIANLKQSLFALTDSGKKQAEQVRSATLTLAELDDMLKAT